MLLILRGIIESYLEGMINLILNHEDNRMRNFTLKWSILYSFVQKKNNIGNVSNTPILHFFIQTCQKNFKVLTLEKSLQIP